MKRRPSDTMVLVSLIMSLIGMGVAIKLTSETDWAIFLVVCFIVSATECVLHIVDWIRGDKDE